MDPAMKQRLIWVSLFVFVVFIAYLVFAFLRLSHRKGGGMLAESEQTAREAEKDIAAMRALAEQVKQSDAAIELTRGEKTKTIPCPQCGFPVTPPERCGSCGWKHPLWEEGSQS